MINKIVYEGKMITNKQGILDTMNKHFCDIVVRLQSELQDCANRYLEYLPPSICDKNKAHESTWSWLNWN